MIETWVESLSGCDFLAAPGKDALRDMVFRGNRILRSGSWHFFTRIGRMPKRLKQDAINGDTKEEAFADSMQIQMAFYAIPAQLYQNTDGELLDSSELILWEGYLMRRVRAQRRLPCVVFSFEPVEATVYHLE